MPDGNLPMNWTHDSGGTLHGIHTSPFMREMEADLALRFVDAQLPVLPLPMVVWRDGVRLSKTNGVYPCCAMFVHCNEYLRRRGLT